MSKGEAKEKGWEKVQIKAFTSWLNEYLSQRSMPITDISTDLSDGVKLITFLELLSGQKVKMRWDHNPPARINYIQNLHIALGFVQEVLDVKLLGIGAEEFVDHNLKMILGFLWTLFKKYRIQVIKQDDKSSEEGLLLWVKKTTEGYRDVDISSYKRSFNDGMAFLALADRYLDGNKEILDYNKFDKANAVENLDHAFDIAEKHLGVPKLLEARDCVEGHLDERSLVLYISLYFHAFVAKQQNDALKKEKELADLERLKLEGNLAEREKNAAELKHEFETTRSRVEQLAQQLAEEKAAREALESQLAAEREAHAREREAHAATRKALEELQEKHNKLEGMVSSLTAALDDEVAGRKKDATEYHSREKVELSGLGVLKKNLEEHIEDLHRWERFLDVDVGEVDFAGEIRPQIIKDIAQKDFDQQLLYISNKLEKENEELQKLLAAREAEVKARNLKKKAKE
eukprot:TRINITY_DN22743_c0_g1_i1.p1 TRINITY_DN22743_c0_g1~~TRINITY_DN22743_c0_g1_i1.p1  ORF type:complete len:460 (-),score=130.21 TRINITY_DN22743_c0_g1_i1:256-1635(-)